MSSESFHARGRDSARVERTFFPPKATIKCVGDRLFRSQAARDMACLLDVDPEVESWECQPLELKVRDRIHIPDLLVTYSTTRRCLLDACETGGDVAISEAAASIGHSHRFITREEREGGWRLRNAQDLLRYGNYRCPLGDRIRVIAALDEVGSFSVAEGLGLFREIMPMAGLASLVLQRILTVDLDEELINPDTVVRRTER
jgi:hypothetical protein